MKATCWHGKRDMRVDDVPDPKILNRRDAIVSDRVRRLPRVRGADVLAVRELEPQRVDRREADGSSTRGRIRLFAHDGRIRGRAGRIRTRPVRGRRTAQGARRHAGRKGTVPVGHLPHGLHCRRDVRHQAGRHDRGLGMRAGRPVRDRERENARCRADHRDRPLCGAARDGRRQGGRHPTRSTTRRRTCSMR